MQCAVSWHDCEKRSYRQSMHYTRQTDWVPSVQCRTEGGLAKSLAKERSYHAQSGSCLVCRLLD